MDTNNLDSNQYIDGIRFITDSKLKEEITTLILADLPEWFGLPESTKEYVQESKTKPYWAYYHHNQPVGFIALKETSRYTAEIYVMGVMKQYHHQYIGKQLYYQLARYACEKGYEYLQVKTVDEGHYDVYDKTRQFYEHMNFRKLECFPTLWDKFNPCLVMIQSVSEAMNHIRRDTSIII